MAGRGIVVGIRVDAALLDYMRANSGAIHVEVREAGDGELAARGLERGREHVFRIPHPEQPDEPYCSFAAPVTMGTSGPTFWFDMADAEVDEGILERALQALLSGLEEAGVDGALLTFSGSRADETSVWDPDRDGRFVDDWDSQLSEVEDPGPSSGRIRPRPRQRTAHGWTRHASLPTKRSDVGVVCGPDGRVYAVGGSTRVPVKTVEAYDIGTDDWSRVRSLSTARRGPGVATAPDGRIYAIGGFGSGQDDDAPTVEVYDAQANRWEAVAPMPLGTMNEVAACTGVDGRIYAATVGSGSPHTFQVYDAAQDAWEVLPTPPIPPHSMEAGPDDRIVLISAAGTVGARTQVALYSLSSGTWSFGRPPSMERYGFGTAAGRDGWIYLVGGQVGGGSVGSPIRAEQRYDVSTDTWEDIPLLPSSRWAPGAAASLDGAIVVVGGLPITQVVDENGAVVAELGAPTDIYVP